MAWCTRRRRSPSGRRESIGGIESCGQYTRSSVSCSRAVVAGNGRPRPGASLNRRFSGQRDRRGPRSSAGAARGHLVRVGVDAPRRAPRTKGRTAMSRITRMARIASSTHSRATRRGSRCDVFGPAARRGARPRVFPQASGRVARAALGPDRQDRRDPPHPRHPRPPARSWRPPERPSQPAPRSADRRGLRPSRAVPAPFPRPARGAPARDRRPRRQPERHRPPAHRSDPREP